MRSYGTNAQVALAACLACLALGGAETARAEPARPGRQAQANQAEIERINKALLAATARRDATLDAKAANAEKLAQLQTAQREALTIHGAARARLAQSAAFALIAADGAAGGQMSGPIAAAHAAHFAAVAQRAQKKAEQAARGASVLANDDTRLTQAALQADAEEAALEALLAKRRNRSTQLSANANAKRAGPQAPPFETPENVRAGWPAAGRVVKAFGELDQNARVTKGATIAVRPGARVFAPAAGEIIYAGLFRSYGRLLIVQLVNDYAVVLAGVEEIHAAPGQRVKAGQPIARMAAGPSAGELYWEVRRNDRPIDPVLWSRDTARNEANRKRSNTRRTTSAQGAAQ